MPQPALHLLLGAQTLSRWRATRCAPFDIENPDAVNAFLHGTLAPDMGNFPGGSTALAHAVHTERTGAVARGLIHGARTSCELAFAWGWLSHVLADAAIHPLVNDSAATFVPDGTATLFEHVRVEVGLDVWFCAAELQLDDIRLRSAFDRQGYRFLADVLNANLSTPVTAERLRGMERGLMIFSHAAVGFARRTARPLAWGETGPRPPLTAALVRRTALGFSGSQSVIRAYLTPRVPDAALVGAVERAMSWVHAEYEACERGGVRALPSYNLEDGSLPDDARHVAWGMRSSRPQPLLATTSDSG